MTKGLRTAAATGKFQWVAFRRGGERPDLSPTILQHEVLLLLYLGEHFPRAAPCWNVLLLLQSLAPSLTHYTVASLCKCQVRTSRSGPLGLAKLTAFGTYSTLRKAYQWCSPGGLYMQCAVTKPISCLQTVHCMDNDRPTVCSVCSKRINGVLQVACTCSAPLQNRSLACKRCIAWTMIGQLSVQCVQSGLMVFSRWLVHAVRRYKTDLLPANGALHGQ